MCNHMGTGLDASTLFTSQALEDVNVGKNSGDNQLTWITQNSV